MPDLFMTLFGFRIPRRSVSGTAAIAQVSVWARTQWTRPPVSRRVSLSLIPSWCVGGSQQTLDL